MIADSDGIAQEHYLGNWISEQSFPLQEEPDDGTSALDGELSLLIKRFLCLAYTP